MLFNPFDFSHVQWLLAPLFIFGRYFMVSLLLFAVFYGWKRRAWFVRKIQQKFPAGNDYRREIGFSIPTSPIFTVVSWLCLGTPLRDDTYTSHFPFEKKAHRLNAIGHRFKGF
jgi:hypothetical protein